MDTGKLDKLISLVTDQNCTVEEMKAITAPFVQDGRIIATDGHVVLSLNAVEFPSYTAPDADKPDITKTLGAWQKYPTVIGIDPDFMKRARVDTFYPYGLLKEAHNTECEGCDGSEMYSCLNPFKSYIIWDRVMNLMYLQLLEIVICFFGGTWTGYLAEDKLEVCVFSNGSVLLAIMPMRNHDPE